VLGTNIVSAQELEHATDRDTGRIQVDTFTLPESKKLAALKYPSIHQRRGQEGWVVLNYMINTSGKAYDIHIGDSSGGRGFEKAAVQSIEKAIYKPALLNGNTIDAGASMRFTFQLEGAVHGAGQKFHKTYRWLLKAIESDDREKSDRLMGRLKVARNSLYEGAYFYVASFFYFKQWGSELQQHEAILKATYIDKGDGFLPEKLLTSLLWSRLSLEFKLNMLAGALNTIDLLRERGLNDEILSKLYTKEQKVEAVRVSDKAFSVANRINGNYRAQHSLLKSSFHISNIEGRIAELRVHCDKGYLGFSFDPDINYRVKSGWRECELTVIGDPDTAFIVVEY
jgi:TonB family protein